MSAYEYLDLNNTNLILVTSVDIRWNFKILGIQFVKSLLKYIHIVCIIQEHRTVVHVLATSNSLFLVHLYYAVRVIQRKHFIVFTLLSTLLHFLL